METILVTDTLFIFPEHEAQLKEAGFAVERLPKPDATEQELVAAIKGKVGYILGGIERVTEPVIAAADELKAMVFAGAAWDGFITAHEQATQKGILIANAPGANSYAVSEYTMTLLLSMVRRTPVLCRTGDKSFITTASLEEMHVGIVGMGRIGERVARMLRGMGAAKVSYWNRTRKPELEQELGITYTDLDVLVSECDAITNHVGNNAGIIFDERVLGLARSGTIFINCGGDKTFDINALYELLAKGQMRAAFDEKPHDDRFNTLDTDTWLCSNDSAAYNTHAANKRASDMAVTSIVNMLTKGDDQYVVNKTSA